MGILVCHIYKYKNFLANRLVFSININVYCLYINILLKHNYIWVKDDTFNKKKISTLLKAKKETSSFRVYKKEQQCLIKHLILSGGFH